MTFNASWLGEKEVADHGDVVRHFGACWGSVALVI